MICDIWGSERNAENKSRYCSSCKLEILEAYKHLSKTAYKRAVHYVRELHKNEKQQKARPA